MSAGDSIDIVPAGEVLAAELASIHAASFTDAWDEAGLARLLKADASRCFVAMEGTEHRPVGFILAFVAVDEAEILTLAVLPQKRRSGIGRRLVAALVELAEEEAVARIHLDVAMSNTAAYSLYKSLGFEDAGVRRKYYPAHGNTPAEDALLLVRSVASAR